MPSTTPLRSRPFPLETDSPDVASDIHNLALNLDTAPIVGQGTLASRPAAAVPGNRWFVSGDSTAANNNKEWLDTGSVWVPATPGVMPVGAMMQWAGSGDPEDFDSTVRWLVCDGRAISRTTYAALFTALATTYGSGNGSTTFNIPDLRGRVPVGADPTGAHLPVNEPALASSGGEEQHTLTSAQMPSHAHTFDGAAGTVPASTSGFVWGADVVAGGSVSAAYTTGAWLNGGITATDSAGSGGAHNNLQPYLAVNHIIRVI